MQQHLFTSSSLHPASRNNSVPAGNNYTQAAGLVWAECNNNPRLGSAAQPRVSGVSARSLTRVAWREARPVALEPSAVHRSLQPSSRTHQLIGSCRGKQRFIFIQIFLNLRHNEVDYSWIFMFIVYCLL